MASRLKYRFVLKTWTRWQRWVSQRTGLTKSTAAKAAPLRKSALSAGCKACWNCSRAPVARLNLLKASNLISSRMRFMFSHRKGALSNCPPVQRLSTSPTPCIPISVTLASARASTDSLTRFHNRSLAVRQLRLLPPRVRARMPRGSTSSSVRKRAPRFANC